MYMYMYVCLICKSLIAVYSLKIIIIIYTSFLVGYNIELVVRQEDVERLMEFVGKQLPGKLCV